ncbi:MAG: N-acetylglucosamine-6-phosphate deacetylase [Gemmatimonadetes bacterium]|jgi:N-acetylglucosamine-6-phosphate deacetylase|nr:N-acetylglucosamine-6-phosphate deacetylase [Gemmatimonadota bacterium]HCK09787.1 N-acetylglucosamine-6-phosphate deacetylase [Candidatus Latescibacterota bacterium]
MQVRGRIVGSEEVSTITLDGDRIAGVSLDGHSEDAIGGEDVWISAGICDLQVNGVGGVSYKAEDLKLEQVLETTEWMYKTGTAKWCPTVTTSSAEDATQGLSLLAQACEESEDAAASFCGFHVEGPYIASEDGPRGAHPLEHTRNPDWDEFQRYQDAAGGRIVIFTLAPERDGSLEFIEKVASTGVIVSIGHTGATPRQIQDAVSAGARMSTHLGNGAHAQIARHPNYIWEQLASDDLWAGIIPDSHHLPPAVLKCFYRAKQKEHICIVSDIASIAGLQPGVYGNTVGGGGVELAENGRLSLAGTPYLAGAALFLDTGIANMVKYTDATLEDAIQMATLNPASLLDLLESAGSVSLGKEATLSLFRWQEGNDKLETVATIVSGRLVYQA